MKIAVPVVSDETSLNNKICDHFGSAPFFAIIETESGYIKIMQNNNAQHEHGMCNPLSTIATEKVDAVLVCGIGAGASSRLESAGISVYLATNNLLSTSVDEFKANKLSKLSANGTCAGHGHGHSCH